MKTEYEAMTANESDWRKDPRVIGNIVDSVNAMQNTSAWVPPKPSLAKVIATIHDAIESAEKDRKKMATFHSIVLLHAEELESVSPQGFCCEIGFAKAYHIEFRKMISLAHRLTELGFDLQKTSDI